MSRFTYSDGSIGYTNGTADLDHPSQQQARLQEQMSKMGQYTSSSPSFNTSSFSTYSPSTTSNVGSYVSAAHGYESAAASGPPVLGPAIVALVTLIFRVAFYVIRAPFWLIFSYCRRLWRRPVLLVKDLAIFVVVGLIALRAYDVGRRPRPHWVENEYHTPSGKFIAFVEALFYEPLVFVEPKSVSQTTSVLISRHRKT